MASVSPNASVVTSDDNSSNDSIDFLKEVQLPNDADDIRSLMNEIGVVVQ